MNSICLVGRVGKDPELRYFESGTQLATTSLAVNGTGRDEEPVWFDLKIWGKTAQVAADYVRKGRQIGVQGRMECERWVDKTTGDKRQKFVVAVERLDLLGNRDDHTSQQAAGTPSSVEDEEVPF